jgi:hypothetical protein
MKIAIIGTAGRSKAPQHRMTRKLYGSMLDAAWQMMLKNCEDWSDVTLQSGGAAWADHVAVSAYKLALVCGKPFKGLNLYLPAPFDGDKYAATKAGGISNYYHRLFTQAVGTDTLVGLADVMQLPGVMVDVGVGFHQRNLEVGKADVLLAFTWGEGSGPADGGTKHCWKNSHAPTKVHFKLSELNGQSDE